MSSLRSVQILGIQFKVGSGPALVDHIVTNGGLVAVPSAPVLVDVVDIPEMREAVIGSDMAITDSGLMVLVWRLLKRDKLERVSGLEYLKLLLARPELKASGATFFVMPTAAARDINLAWLKSEGFATAPDDCYLAPMYGSGRLHDEKLLAILRKKRPKHVILCLGGGVQERLGYYLRNELRQNGAVALSDATLGYQPSTLPAGPGIHCIGAAIGFLSGDQVKIPMWVDYLYLGWLWRITSAPAKFLPRYKKAVRLVGIMWKYGASRPI